MNKSTVNSAHDVWSKSANLVAAASFSETLSFFLSLAYCAAFSQVQVLLGIPSYIHCGKAEQVQDFKSVGNLIIKIIEFFFFMSEDSIKFYIINYRKFHSGGSMLHLFGLL